jgi:Surface adhesin CshA repetitive domain
VVLKKFILGSLLVAGLTACPIVETGPEPVVSPIAKDDAATTNPSSTATIKPADNDIKGSAELVFASIDLNPNTSVQDDKFSDSTGKGTFQLNKSTGEVKFQPIAGKTGDAKTSYTIKDTNGNVSSVASIKVTIGTVASTGPIRVLFIGNSRTSYTGCSTPVPGPNYDIPSILKNIALNETRKLEVTSLAYCGYSLEQHWNNGPVDGTARGLIARRTWDYVVLQANTAETDTVSELQTQVSRFNFEILAAGAKTILYENWSKATISAQPALTSIFKSVATNINIKLAPVGQSWKLSGLTDAQLYNTDGDLVHALPTGAYAAASTFYWMFYNKAPSTTTGVPAGVLSTEASAARNGALSAYAALETAFRLP